VSIQISPALKCAVVDYVVGLDERCEAVAVLVGHRGVSDVAPERRCAPDVGTFMIEHLAVALGGQTLAQSLQPALIRVRR
jgi:hypothetical protein